MVCDYGNVYETRLESLRSNRANSCGCLHAKIAAQHIAKISLTHGMRRHPLYNTWQKVIDRCENPSYKQYHYCGGRGISVCPRWHDVIAFIEDIERILGPRAEGMTLNRIHNNLGYKPSNVRWATKSEQVLNRRPKSGSRLGKNPAVTT